MENKHEPSFGEMSIEDGLSTSQTETPSVEQLPPNNILAPTPRTEQSFDATEPKRPTPQSISTDTPSPKPAEHSNNSGENILKNVADIANGVESETGLDVLTK